MKRKKGIQNFLFDYVIIGGGSAGCVLANRLTQCGRYNVALIEAGGMDSSPWIRYPVGYFKTMGNKEFDWCYYTERDSVAVRFLSRSQAAWSKCSLSLC